MNRPPLNWIVGVGRFWYHFIIGDDWTIAATVIIGLALTALLLSLHISAWWLVPTLVIITIAADLRRASRVRRNVFSIGQRSKLNGASNREQSPAVAEEDLPDSYECGAR